MTVQDQSETTGYSVAVLGALALIGSLWLPWYSFRIPAAVIDSVDNIARQLGFSETAVNSSAQLVNQLGPFHITAWRVMTAIPGLLLAVGVVGGGLSLLATSGRASSVANLVTFAGVIGVALVVYRWAVPPGPDGLLHPAWGLWLALGGSVGVAVGGALAGGERTERLPDLTLSALPLGVTAPAHDEPFTAGSIPPPSR
jgi:hypothetical protein